eukprot:SAG11_NODE_3169_length_2637_cov_10.122537_2_plen_81_part_00
MAEGAEVVEPGGIGPSQSEAIPNISSMFSYHDLISFDGGVVDVSMKSTQSIEARILKRSSSFPFAKRRGAPLMMRQMDSS